MRAPVDSLTCMVTGSPTFCVTLEVAFDHDLSGAAQGAAKQQNNEQNPENPARIRSSWANGLDTPSAAEPQHGNI